MRSVRNRKVSRRQGRDQMQRLPKRYLQQRSQEPEQCSMCTFTSACFSCFLFLAPSFFVSCFFFFSFVASISLPDRLRGIPTYAHMHTHTHTRNRPNAIAIARLGSSKDARSRKTVCADEAKAKTPRDIFRDIFPTSPNLETFQLKNVRIAPKEPTVQCRTVLSRHSYLHKKATGVQQKTRRPFCRVRQGTKGIMLRKKNSQKRAAVPP